MRIRVGGSRTQRWNSSFQEDQPPSAENPNVAQAEPSVPSTREELRKDSDSNTSAPAAPEHDSERTPPRISEDNLEFSAYSPSLRKNTLSESVTLTRPWVGSKPVADSPAYCSQAHPPLAVTPSAIPAVEAGTSIAHNDLISADYPAHDSPTSRSHVSGSAEALPGRCNSTVGSSRPHATGPCLWPVGEAESRLIKYFFNVLVGWVSDCK